MTDEQKKGIQQEAQKMIEFFVEHDLHWLGYVSEDTIEAARMQKVEIPKDKLDKDKHRREGI